MPTTDDFQIGEFAKVGKIRGYYSPHHPSWNGSIGRIIKKSDRYIYLEIDGEAIAFYVDSLIRLSPLEQLAHIGDSSTAGP